MITVVLPVSRKDYLLPVFKSLDGLLKPDQTELLLIIDGNKELEMMVDQCLDFVHFSRIQVRNFGDAPASELNDRRKRISEIHNFAKQFIPDECQQVFLVEDDTVFQAEALVQLKASMDQTGAAFVQGVEVGRWKTPYIGGWFADDIYDPERIVSVKPSEGLQDIDAGGLYCALVDANSYLEHKFEPFDKQGNNGLSCDVNFGLWLKGQGKKVMMNWDVQCGHYKEGRVLRLAEIRPVVVVFEKDNNGRWLGTNHWADEEVS